LTAVALVAFCVLLVANGFVSSQIGVDAHVGRSVASDQVPVSITDGGPIIDGTRDPARSYAMPPMTVALSFDDGPDPRWTPEVLKVLRKHDVPGTFFVVGSMAARHPELIRDLRDSGAEIGIHTLTHPDLRFVSRSRMQHELSETQLAISRCGRGHQLPRPSALRLLAATVSEDEGVALTAAVRERRRPRPGVRGGALVVMLAV
jgi:peptidoglycan/xylan/chitin deacetylase (PgdA/CDA1 family)